jgi:hypothetical protein
LSGKEKKIKEQGLLETLLLQRQNVHSGVRVGASVYEGPPGPVRIDVFYISKRERLRVPLREI